MLRSSSRPRLEAPTDGRACFETARCAGLLSMTPQWIGMEPQSRDEPLRQQLQPLDRIARDAPGRIGQRLEDGRTRAVIGRREVARQRVELEPEIVRDRAMQRPVLRPELRSRQLGDRDEQRIAQIRLRRAPEDVQSVADLHLLEVAEMRVEAAQRLGLPDPGLQSEIRVEPQRARARHDVGREGGRAARVKVGGEGVLVDELFERREFPVQARRGRAAASGDRRSRRRCGAWPARPRRDR